MLPVKYSRNDRYKSFLDFCREKVYPDTIVTHMHHIQPEYEGGPKEKWNLIKLSVEDHITAHRILWEEFGNYRDLHAVQILGKGKNVTREEMILSAKFREANKTPEQRNKDREDGIKREANRTKEERLKINLKICNIRKHNLSLKTEDEKNKIIKQKGDNYSKYWNSLTSEEREKIIKRRSDAKTPESYKRG